MQLALVDALSGQLNDTKRHKRTAEDMGVLQGELATDFKSLYADLWFRVEERVRNKADAEFFREWLVENGVDLEFK